MSLEEVFEPAERYYREQAAQEAWGHLAPVKNKKYRGRLVYAVGCLGNDDLNPMLLCMELGDLDSSPWWYDFIQDYMQSQETKPGYVYEFEGYFRNYQLYGETRVLLNANMVEDEGA